MSTSIQATSKSQMRTVYLLTAVAALGGLLFGYDTAVISGAIGFLKIKFQLSAAMTGWAASSAIFGCIFGAMAAGWLSDRFGRRQVLLGTAVLFAVSAIGAAMPENLTQFTIFRFIGGLGIGAASMVSPLYITELAPARIRGRLVSYYQLAIVIGILVIFFVNSLIQNAGDETWNIEYGWRYMMASGVIPAILFLVALFFVPESPRWLTKEGRDDDALKILIGINGTEQANIILEEVKATLHEEQGTLRELFTGRFQKAVWVGIFLAVFSQIQGINAIMYYAPEIFKAVGAGTEAAFQQTVIIGLINLLFTFVAIYWVDRLGRRTLLLIGGLGMAISLLMVGFSFYFGWTGYGLLLFILLYIGSFAASYGPVTWVVISEIFPIKMRGVAMSVATFALWVAVYLVTQLFPMMLEMVGPAGTFWIFGAMALLSFGFVWARVPETKGRTLEEIEKSW
ncbi:MAG: sugar porter family MFS transporter [Saprospiraceae bacterium]